MKKTLAILLTLMLAAGTFASCGGKDKKEETKTPESDVTENIDNKEENEEAAVDTSAYTTLGIIDSIYAQKSPAFMTMSIPVDLADADAVKMYLGLDDASKIAEASVTESMMGAQAYSLVVARVAQGQDVKAVAEEMNGGIDPRKWVCVGADDIKYTTEGDLICFCMISTDFKEDFTADDAMNAFNKIMTGEAQYVETSVSVLPEEGIEEMPEVDPEEAPAEEVEDDMAESEQKPVEKPEDVPATEPEEIPAVQPEVTPEAPEEAPAEQPEEAPVVTPDEAPAETPAETALSPEEIVNKMYEIKMPEFMLGFIPVDLSDKDACSSYLGLDDASKIESAIVSEPMIGAQAYSLVVAKVAPGQDANAVANEMKAGIDPRKWVCVEADDIQVSVSGDYVCFCMISTDFADQYTAKDAMNAFKSVVK